MKYAADFRSSARNALTGRWAVAVIAGLIASLLGAVASNGPELKFNIDGNGANAGVHFAGQQVYTFGSGWNEQLTRFIIGGASILFAVALVLAVVYFVVGSVIEIGYYRFNLDLVDRKKEPEINTVS